MSGTFDKELERMESDPGFDGGFGVGVAKSYRRKMQFIRAARNEQDFYAMKSLHYEKLKGSRSHQRSMRLNRQFRLILTIEKDVTGNTIVILAIEDYH